MTRPINRDEVLRRLDAHDRWLTTEPQESGSFEGRLDLRYCHLQGFDFRDRNLGFGLLEGANLEQADLRNAWCYRTNFAKAELYGARCDYADLEQADLSQARCQGASFPAAKLRKAKLWQAKFSHCWWSPWPLTLTVLNGAEMNECILPSGEIWQSFVDQVSPQLLTLRGHNLADLVAASGWTPTVKRCQWPICLAFDTVSDDLHLFPALLQPRVAQWLHYFEAGILPPPAHPATPAN